MASVRCFEDKVVIEIIGVFAFAGMGGDGVIGGYISANAMSGEPAGALMSVLDDFDDGWVGFFCQTVLIHWENY